MLGSLALFVGWGLGFLLGSRVLGFLSSRTFSTLIGAI